VNGDPSFIGTTLAKNAAKIQAARLISARLTAPSDINWPKYAMSFPPKTGALYYNVNMIIRKDY